jgi:two-component system, NtrC family, sensor histidine kinase PilS
MSGTEKNKLPFGDEVSGLRFFLSRSLTALLILVIISLLKVFEPELANFSRIVVLFLFYISIMVLCFVSGIRRNYLILLMTDAAFITWVVYLTGSQDSQFQFLYLVLVVFGGFYLKRESLHLLAAIVIALFSLLLILEYLAVIPLMGAHTMTDTQVPYTIGVNFAAIFLVSLIIGVLSVRIRRLTGQVELKEKRLREITILKNQIVDSVPSAMLTTNANFQVTFMNNVAREFLRMNQLFDEVELMNNNVNDFLPVSKILLESDDGRMQRGEHEFENGTIIGLNMTKMYSSGKFTGLLILFRDLTEWRAMEKSVLFKNSLMSLGEMAAGIAHEIRNPLASIQGAVQLLKEQDTSKQADELYEIIRQELARLGNTIQDFLSFTRENGPMAEPANVCRLVAEVTNLFEKGCKEGIELSVSPDAYTGEAWVKCERGKFKRVIWNILKNAEKAVQYQDSKRISVDIEMGIPEITIRISDNGKGIPDKIRERIFQPYFSTFAKGFGLGLSISKSIVEEMGGRIEVGGTFGEGAVFSIAIPRCDRLAEEILP